jgi:5-methylcytosine-specific restriction endonuclease McrA
VKRPCLDCGTPADNTRCTTCDATHRTAKDARQSAQRKQSGPRIYDGAPYRRAAAIIRATATRCHLCGQPARPGDPWQADHIIPIADGGHTGPLAPAHRSCNIAKSNRSRRTDNQ